MRMVILIVAMAIVAWLTSVYLTQPSIDTGHGKEAPQQVLETVKQESKQIEQDWAKRANAPPPAP
jgi:hypothetical protein